MALTDELTPQWLKDRFLVGVDLTLDNGDPYPEAVYTQSISSSIAWLEHELGIALDPQAITGERHDALDANRDSWWSFRIDYRPVMAVTGFRIRFGSYPPVEIPVTWVQLLSKEHGQIHLIPSEESLGSYLFRAGIPMMVGDTMTPYNYIPGYFEFDYTAGFENAAAIPADIKHAIGLKSAMLPLDIAGGLLVGAGIAMTSTSMDGLSQSVNTTSSATNSGFGARVLQYEREMKALLPALRAKYGPLNFGCI